MTKQYTGALVLTATLLLGWLSSQPSQAQAAEEELQPWYVKGRLGLSYSDASKNDIDRRFANAGIDAHVVAYDDNDVGYGLGLGYWLNDNWSLEAGYLDLGQFEIDIVGSYSDPQAFYDVVEELHAESANGFYAALLYHWSLSEDWRLFVQGGLFSWQGDYETYLGDTNQVGDNKQNHTDPYLGIGVEYALRPRWELLASWDRYRLDNHDVDYLNLGLSYRFGRKQRSQPQTVAQTEPVAEPEPVPETIAEPIAEPAPVAVAISESACNLLQGSLEGVSFESGSAHLTPAAEDILRDAARVLNEVPDVAVEIQAHTDYVGTASTNQTLSEARAAAVEAFLIGQGVAAGRLSSVGMGESQPIADNQTEAGRAANRRVELKQKLAEDGTANSTTTSSTTNAAACP